MNRKRLMTLLASVAMLSTLAVGPASAQLGGDQPVAPTDAPTTVVQPSPPTVPVPPVVNPEPVPPPPPPPPVATATEEVKTVTPKPGANDTSGPATTTTPPSTDTSSTSSTPAGTTPDPAAQPAQPEGPRIPGVSVVEGASTSSLYTRYAGGRASTARFSFAGASYDASSFQFNAPEAAPELAAEVAPPREGDAAVAGSAEAAAAEGETTKTVSAASESPLGGSSDTLLQIMAAMMAAGAAAAWVRVRRELATEKI